MKHLISISFIFIFVLFLFNPLLAQDVEAIKDLGILLFGKWLVTTVGFVAGTMTFTSGFLFLWNAIVKKEIENNIVKQVIAIAMSIPLSLIGWWLTYGLFENFTAIESICFAIGISFTSNGVFTFGKNITKEVKQVLKARKNEPIKTTEEDE